MLAHIVYATAAALFAAASIPATQSQTPSPAVQLAPARPGMRCPSGGRAVGEDVRNGYFIATILELHSRDKDPKVIGYIYAGSDGQDYLQLVGGRTHVMRAGEVAQSDAFMVYCFSKPWMGK